MAGGKGKVIAILAIVIVVAAIAGFMLLSVGKPATPTTAPPSTTTTTLTVTETATTVMTTTATVTETAAPPETTTTAAPSKVKFSSYIVMAYGSEMTGLDPSTEFSNSVILLNIMYDTLTRYDYKTGKVVPCLAESWEVKEDGKVWVFHLRKDAKFHDGTPVTAKAVKLSIERTIKLGEGAAFIWDPVEKIETPDDYTVVFYLKYPAPLDIIAASAYGAFIMNPKYINVTPDEFTSKGLDAGSGPYKLVKWDPRNEVVLEAFKDYWGGFAPGAPEKVIIKIVPDSKTQELQVINGEIDIASSVPPEDIAKLKENPKVKVYEYPSYMVMYALLNTKKEPLKNKLVRKALAYAIPYDRIVEEAGMGYAERAWSYIPPGMLGYEKVFTYEQDLEKAKELLAKAGYPNGGFKLLLTYTAGDDYERRAAEIMKDAFSKLGIDLEIQPMPWEQQWELAKSDPEKAQDIFIFYWWPTLLSPYDFLYNMFHTEEEPFFNLCYYSNKTFDKLIDDAWALEGTDRAKAHEMYVEAQKILAEDVPAIPLMVMKQVFVVNKDVKNFDYNPAYPNVIFFNQLSIEGR